MKGLNRAIIKFDVRVFNDDVAGFDEDHDEFNPRKIHNYAAETAIDYDEEFNIMRFHGVRIVKQSMITTITQTIIEGLHTVSVI